MQSNPQKDGGDEPGGLSKAPATLFHRTKLCRFFALGACERGEQCTFAHQRAALVPTPDLYRTKLCPLVHTPEGCRNTRCRFAHDREDFRRTPSARLANRAPPRHPYGARAGHAQKRAGAGKQPAPAGLVPKAPGPVVFDAEGIHQAPAAANAELEAACAAEAAAIEEEGLRVRLQLADLCFVAANEHDAAQASSFMRPEAQAVPLNGDAGSEHEPADGDRGQFQEPPRSMPLRSLFALVDPPAVPGSAHVGLLPPGLDQSSWPPPASPSAELPVRVVVRQSAFGEPEASTSSGRRRNLPNMRVVTTELAYGSPDFEAQPTSPLAVPVPRTPLPEHVRSGASEGLSGEAEPPTFLRRRPDLTVSTKPFGAREAGPTSPLAVPVTDARSFAANATVSASTVPMLPQQPTSPGKVVVKNTFVEYEEPSQFAVPRRFKTVDLPCAAATAAEAVALEALGPVARGPATESSAQDGVPAELQAVEVTEAAHGQRMVRRRGMFAPPKRVVSKGSVSGASEVTNSTEQPDSPSFEAESVWTRTTGAGSSSIRQARAGSEPEAGERGAELGTAATSEDGPHAGLLRRRGSEPLAPMKVVVRKTFVEFDPVVETPTTLRRMQTFQ